MRIFKIYFLLALVGFMGCSNSDKAALINSQINSIENRLMEFRSPYNMLNPDSSQKVNPMNLFDRMEDYKVPGLGIAVINNNKIIWTKSYGLLNKATEQPVTEETIFEAASTSKFVVSIISLYFVEKGLIDLDEDINHYLKSWKIPDNEYTKDEKVTLRRLLTHSSGLPTTNFDYDEAVGYPTLLDVLNGKSPAINKPAIPEFIPGSQWQYSNIGYDVIQIALEDITGKPFVQIIKEIIFDPLGMNNSTFSYPLETSKNKQEAMPHDSEGNPLTPIMHMTALAHGGLTTTPKDLALFINEIMLSYKGISEKIISQNTVKQLFSSEFELDPNMYGIPISEGLGVLLIDDNGELVFTHPGSNIPGLTCWVLGWIERGTAVVIMTNGVMGEVLSMEIISAIKNVYIQ